MFFFFIPLSSCNGVGSLPAPYPLISFTCGGLSSVVLRILAELWRCALYRATFIFLTNL